MGHGRRIEDRLRELCVLLAETSGNERELLLELQIEIHEYSRKLQNKTAAAVLNWPIIPKERRKKAA